MTNPTKLLAQRVLARRRLLQFAQLTHPAYSAGWVHDDICKRLEKFSEDVKNKLSPRLMLLVPPRHGKLLADDTMVYTKAGWKTHGTLEVGDEVLGLKAWTKVIGVSAPGWATHWVVTNAGTRILTHLQHEWAVSLYCGLGLAQKVGSVDGYLETVVETQEFLKWKAHRKGSMRSHNKNMRRFYLPQPTILDIITKEEWAMFKHRRRPPNGAMIAIDDVYEAETPQPGRCIQVDASDGLYLVTRDLVPTHNSELASIRFPAWHIGHNPTHEIINVGYNLDLPMKFSRKVREVMRDAQYQAVFPDSRLDPDAQSVEAWNTTHGGGFTAAGVGGGITGKGCFSAQTVVTTATGTKPISEVAVGDYVYGYDHDSKKITLTAVVAVSAAAHSEGTGVYAGVRCTSDHELYSPATGKYHQADEIKSQRLSVLWLKEGAPRERVYSVPQNRSERGSGTHDLRPLLSSVCRVLKNTKRVLLTALQRCLAQSEGYDTSRGLRVVSSSAVASRPEKVLHKTVLRRDESSEQHDRQGLQWWIPPYEEAGDRTRRKMRSDRSHKTARGASYRPRPGAQYHVEPDFVIEGGTRFLSRTVGRTTEDLAELVRKRSPQAHVVYDIQTVVGNVFADGVLAHNCHILIIDDPIKNQEEADSIITRDKLWDWYQSTAYTRLAPGGGVLCIETFWNDDDLAGRLQQAMRADAGADQFEIIRYPALSEAWEYRDETDYSVHRFENEQVGTALTLLRPKDTCLHEDRYPTDALKRIRANLQPRIWSALYQQNPVPDEGMYFKKEFFRYQKAPPGLHGTRIYTAWDFAIGEKQQNDWTVGATVMQDHTDTLYVLEVFRMKGDSMQIIEAMLDVAQRWSSDVTAGYLIGAEDGQIWRSILPLLKKRMAERKQYPPYEVLRPLTDKLARARPLQGRMQQGRVVFPEGASWVAQAEQELLRFPAGAHDDVVDALAWATHLCIGKEPPRIAQPPPLKSWRDALDSSDTGGGHMAA